MTDILVPALRSKIAVADILPGRPVRAAHAMDIARLYHWMLGRGAQLIPAHAPGAGIVLTAGNDWTLSYYTRRRIQATRRVWLLSLRAASGSASAVEIKTPSGGTAVSYYASSYLAGASYIVHPEAIAQSQTAGSFDINIKASDANLIIDSIACVEAPRATLVEGGTDLATDPMSFLPGRPIWAGGGTPQGLGRFDAPSESQANYGRRVGHFSWSVPYQENGSSTDTYAASDADTTFTGIFRLAVPFTPRALALDNATGVAVTTGTLTWNALVRVGTAGATGQVRVTGSSTTSTISFTNTSYAWATPGSFTPLSEDLSTTDGLRGAAWDDWTFELRRSAGSGTVYCAAICVWEN